MKRLIFPALAVFLTTGCVIALPFDARPSFNRVSEARAFNARHKGPVTVAWEPANFPERVDTQGASGFVGGGSQTLVPTGVAIAARVSELLDASVGIAPVSDKKITIKIVSAESKFEFSAGVFNATPVMDFGSCVVEVEFSTPTKRWAGKFSSTQKDTEVGGKSPTGVLARAWDDIALQIVKDISTNI